MAELQIKVTAQQGQLTINDVELERVVREELKKYELEVTEENITEAKDARATLNKVSKALDAKRLEMKKDYCIPLVEFEDKVKRIKALIDDGSDNLKVQLDVFEQKRIEEKQLEIAEYFSSLNFELISLDKIFDSKWLNKTCNDWKQQIDSIINRINQELDLINNFDLSSEEKTELKGFYLDCLDITNARTQFDAQKQRREALKKMQQEQSSQNAPQPQQSVSTETCRDETPKEVEQLKKERIVAEFIGTRPFFDEMNGVTRKHKVQVKIIEREDM